MAKSGGFQVADLPPSLTSRRLRSPAFDRLFCRTTGRSAETDHPPDPPIGPKEDGPAGCFSLRPDSGPDSRQRVRWPRTGSGLESFLTRRAERALAQCGARTRTAQSCVERSWWCRLQPTGVSSIGTPSVCCTLTVLPRTPNRAPKKGERKRLLGKKVRNLR